MFGRTIVHKDFDLQRGEPGHSGLLEKLRGFSPRIFYDPWSIPNEIAALTKGLPDTVVGTRSSKYREGPTLGRGAGMSNDGNQVIYKVVVNHEEQYSIWPVDRENAPGWRDAGKHGTKAECLEYIAQVWPDIRPLSLRQRAAQPDGKT